MSNLYFVVFAVLFLVALATALTYYLIRARRSADTSWEDLLHRLKLLDRDAIATVALDGMADPENSQNESFGLDPTVIWNLLGGLEGLEVIQQNCQVLVELATYVQRWYPEAVMVAEQLRLNAREIEWHVGRLQGAAKTGNLKTSFATYAQPAVVSYYRMTRNVLALYEAAGFSRMAELQAAI